MYGLLGGFQLTYLRNNAGVVKLVDTLDLGSNDQKSWGFKSLRPHHFS